MATRPLRTGHHLRTDRLLLKCRCYCRHRHRRRICRDNQRVCEFRVRDFGGGIGVHGPAVVGFHPVFPEDDDVRVGGMGDAFAKLFVADILEQCVHLLDAADLADGIGRLVEPAIALVTAKGPLLDMDEFVGVLEIVGHVGHEQEHGIDGFEDERVVVEGIGGDFEDAAPAEEHGIDDRTHFLEEIGFLENAKVEPIGGGLGQGIGLGRDRDERGEAIAGHDLAEPKWFLFANGHVDDRVMIIGRGGESFMFSPQSSMAHDGEGALFLFPRQAFEHEPMGLFVLVSIHICFYCGAADLRPL